MQRCVPPARVPFTDNQSCSTGVFQMTGRGPGPVWQQCYDQTSGYPYYWNTATNQVVAGVPGDCTDWAAQVRWDCPPELRQEWQPPLPPSLPPPSLLTQVSMCALEGGETAQRQQDKSVHSFSPILPYFSCREWERGPNGQCHNLGTG